MVSHFVDLGLAEIQLGNHLSVPGMPSPSTIGLPRRVPARHDERVDLRQGWLPDSSIHTADPQPSIQTELAREASNASLKRSARKQTQCLPPRHIPSDR